MAKRIFVSFAIEDKNERDLFVGQAKNESVPYEFIDMSVKEPWSTSWKTNCRQRIKSCSGFIVLITKNLEEAEGAIWEINCAKDEEIPILGVYMKGCSILHCPNELMGLKKIDWTWKGIAEFVNEL